MTTETTDDLDQVATDAARQLAAGVEALHQMKADATRLDTDLVETAAKAIIKGILEGVTEALEVVTPVTFSSPSTAIERGEEGTARAARRWTAAEAAQVERAIEDVARKSPDGFTTADVWAHLGDGFPVTKGIAAKMTAAKRAGVIVNTGGTAYNDHPSREHAHGQRLTVWKAAR